MNTKLDWRKWTSLWKICLDINDTMFFFVVSNKTTILIKTSFHLWLLKIILIKMPSRVSILSTNTPYLNSWYIKKIKCIIYSSEKWSYKNFSQTNNPFIIYRRRNQIILIMNSSLTLLKLVYLFIHWIVRREINLIQFWSVVSKFYPIWL